MFAKIILNVMINLLVKKDIVLKIRYNFYLSFIDDIIIYTNIIFISKSIKIIKDLVLSNRIQLYILKWGIMLYLQRIFLKIFY